MASDDEYGLEPAKPTKAAPADDYGLEAAGGTTTATEAPEPPTDEEISEAYPDATPKVREALKSGKAPFQKPTQFETENKIPKWYGFTPSNIAKNAVEGAAGLVKSGAQAAYDTTLGQMNPETGEMEHGLGGLVGLNTKGEFAPMERNRALMQKYVTDPAVAEWDKGSEMGGVAGAGHKLAAMTPLVGPWAASLGEQAGKGDIGGAFGQAAGTVGAGELLARTPSARALADKAVRGTPITEAGKLAAAKEQALAVKKPSISETEYAQKVTNALPELQRIAQDNRGKIKTPRQAVDAINARIRQMEAPIGDHLANLPDEVIHPDQYVGAMNTSLDQALSNAPAKLTAKEMESAKTKVDELLEAKPQTLGELEKIRRRLNDEAEDYFSSRPADKRAMDSSDATAIAQRAAAGYLRDQLYGTDTAPGWLERAGVSAVDQAGRQVPIREFRQSVGNLLEVRNHFEDAITRAEATGDWKPFGKLFSGPSIAAGGIGMVGGAAIGGPFGALFGTLTGEGLKAWGDYLRTKNPNLNVEKMFRNLENTGRPNTLDIRTRQPILQHPSGTGPTIQSPVPLGPMTEPPPFEVPGNRARPNESQLWQQQVGGPPPLETGAPRSPYREPIGPEPPPPEKPLGPITGPQQELNLPEPQHELFNLPQTPVPPAPGEIGGPGREGTLAPIEPTKPTPKAPLELGQKEDLGPGLGVQHEITRDGKRVGSVTVEDKGDGVTHVHWLSGEGGPEGEKFTPAEIREVMGNIQKEYPATQKFTYDRRRVAKGGLTATTEPRSVNVKPLMPVEHAPTGSIWEGLSQEVQDAMKKEKAGPIQKSGMEDLATGDTFVDDTGEPRRIMEITDDGRIHTADGTERTYDSEIEHHGEINSPMAQLARGGKLIEGKSPEQAAREAREGVKEMVRPGAVAPEDAEAATTASPKGSSVELMKNPLDVSRAKVAGKLSTGSLLNEFNKFTKRALGVLKPERAVENPELAAARVEPLLEDEARYGIAQNNGAEAWYTKQMDDHDRIVGEMRPELSGNPTKLSIFKMAEAILSAGQKPYGNFKATIRAFDHYAKTGEWSYYNPESVERTAIEEGQKVKALREGAPKKQKPQNIAMDDLKVGDRIVDADGNKKNIVAIEDGHLVTAKSWGPRGMAAYGQAFDMLNRLIKEKGEEGASKWLLEEHPVSELREYNSNVSGSMDDMQHGAMILGEKRGPFALNLHGMEAPFTADMWVARTWNRWMGTLEFDPEGGRGGKGEITTDAPRNKSERALMKQSFANVAQKLGMTTSALQAVMWYYEQALYSAHGVPKESWSFSDAAQRTWDEERGIETKTKSGKTVKKKESSP